MTCMLCSTGYTLPLSTQCLLGNSNCAALVPDAARMCNSGPQSGGWKLWTCKWACQSGSCHSCVHMSRAGCLFAAAEMADLREAVKELRSSIDALAINADLAQEKILLTNLRDARASASLRVQQLSVATTASLVSSRLPSKATSRILLSAQLLRQAPRLGRPITLCIS